MAAIGGDLSGIRVLVLDGRDRSIVGPGTTRLALESMGRVLALALRFLGCEVIWCKPGDEYLDLAGTVDLGLVHLNFGRREGFHTTRAGLRAAEDIAKRWPQVPLILYTGHCAEARDLVLPHVLAGRLVDMTLLVGPIDPFHSPSPSLPQAPEDEEKAAAVLEDVGERLRPFVQAQVALARGERTHGRTLASLGRPDIERAKIPERFGVVGFTADIARAMLRTVLGETRSRAEAAEVLGLTIDELEKAKADFDAPDENGGLRDAVPGAVDPRRVLLVGFGKSDRIALISLARARGYDPVVVEHPHLAAAVAIRTGARCTLLGLDDGLGAVAARGILRLVPGYSLLIVCNVNPSLPALRVVEHLQLGELLATAEEVHAYGRALDVVSEAARLRADADRQLDAGGRDRFPRPAREPGPLGLGLWRSYLGISEGGPRRPRLRALEPLWIRIIEDALDARGTIRKAAEALGTSRTRLAGWMAELGIAPRNTTRRRTPPRGSPSAPCQP